MSVITTEKIIFLNIVINLSLKYNLLLEKLIESNVNKHITTHRSKRVKNVFGSKNFRFNEDDLEFSDPLIEQ